MSRRAYLAGAGTAALGGVAGCTGLTGGSDELTVAYMPIFPGLQYFVMDAEEYFDEVDADVEGREFSDGPAIVQAFAGEVLDVAVFGVVPATIVIDLGRPRAGSDEAVGEYCRRILSLIRE